MYVTMCMSDGGLPAVAHLTSTHSSQPHSPPSTISDNRAGPCVWRPASSSLMHPLRRPFVRSQCFRHDFLCCTANPTLFTTTTPFSTNAHFSALGRLYICLTAHSSFRSSHSPLCAPSPHHRRFQRLPHLKPHHEINITAIPSQHAEEEGRQSPGQGETEGQGTERSCNRETSMDEEVCQKLR